MKLSVTIPSISVLALAPLALAQTPLLSPGQPIVGVAATPTSTTSAISVVGTVAGANNYPAAESPNLGIDGDVLTKYLNFAEVNTGFIVTLPSELEIYALTGFLFTTANDATERDPINITLEGTFASDPTAAAAGATWTSLYNGPSGLIDTLGRRADGANVTVDNGLAFNTYRLLVTEVRDGAAANSMQFAEVQFYGTVVPEPSVVALLATGGVGLAFWGLRRRK